MTLKELMEDGFRIVSSGVYEQTSNVIVFELALEKVLDSKDIIAVMINQEFPIVSNMPLAEVVDNEFGISKSGNNRFIDIHMNIFHDYEKLANALK